MVAQWLATPDFHNSFKFSAQCAPARSLSIRRLLQPMIGIRPRAERARQATPYLGGHGRTLYLPDDKPARGRIAYIDSGRWPHWTVRSRDAAEVSIGWCC